MAKKANRKSKRKQSKPERKQFHVSGIPVRHGVWTPKQALAWLEHDLVDLQCFSRQAVEFLYESEQERYALWSLQDGIEGMTQAAVHAVRTAESVEVVRQHDWEWRSEEMANRARLLLLCARDDETSKIDSNRRVINQLVTSLVEYLGSEAHELEREHRRAARKPDRFELAERYHELDSKIFEHKRQQRELREELEGDFYQIIHPLLEHEYPVEGLEKERDEIKAKVWPEEDGAQT